MSFESVALSLMFIGALCLLAASGIDPDPLEDHADYHAVIAFVLLIVGFVLLAVGFVLMAVFFII